MTVVEPTSGSTLRLTPGSWRSGPHRKRVVLLAVGGVFVLLVGLAFALGGSGSGGGGAGASGSPSKSTVSSSTGSVATGTAGSTGTGGGVTAPGAAQSTLGLNSPAGVVSGDTLSGASSSGSQTAHAPTRAEPQPRSTAAGSGSGSGSSVAATRIVKTGTVELTVAKGKVAATIAKLSQLATDEGGYVASSQTDTGTDPSGEITVRIPVAKFGAAVSSTATLGKVSHQTTQADDVTGKYVDLGAQEHALQQTRATYLTILSHATTIGATLAVQQRIDDVEQQIDELHGQLKVLGNQSAYSTLTVDVSQHGSAVAIPRHHQRSGLAKAWTTSWHRFNRGFDAIVAAIGPLVLALMVLAVFALLIRLAFRATSRTSPESPASGAGH